MSYQAVLFDIDGTLVDSNEQHVTAWAFAFREAGRPQALAAVREQIGKGSDLLVPALLPDADDVLVERLSAAHGRYFKEMYLDAVRPFPHAADLVRRVHAGGRKVVLASSAKREELDHYVALLGVRDLLAATTSTDDVETSKPAPDIFGTALDKIGMAPAAAVIVGDTPYDIEAGARAGVAAIGLTSGPFAAERLRDAGAIAIFPDVAALLRDFARSPLAG